MHRPDPPQTIARLVGKPRASITEVLEARALANGERTFVLEAGRAFSYSESWDLSCRVAGFLRSLDIQGQTNCVASFLSKRSEGLWCWFGTLLTGAVHACLNWEHRGDLLADMTNRTGARLMFTEAAGWAQLSGLKLTGIDTVVFIDSIPPGVAALGLKVYTLEQALQNDAPDITHPEPGDVASLIFSSGSTGRAKAVLLPHNMFTRGGARLAESQGLDESDIIHDTSPLYHIAGQLHNTSMTLLAGATLAIFPRFSRSRFFAQVNEVGATYMGCFANVLRYLMSDPERSDDAYNTLRYVMVAQTREAESEAFAQRFGVTTLDSYGMTEGEPLTLPDPQNMPPASCGIVNPDFEIAILDDAGNRLGCGESGRIVFRPRVPDIMMRAYAGDDQATVKAWRDLWFHTQDIGKLDQDGYLYYVDRLKFTIRRKGENIIPAELEQVVRTHPAVEDCVAVGVPTDDGDVDIKLFAARVPGTDLQGDDIRRFVTGKVARFMVPQIVVVLDELPYTPAGKIDRDKL